MEDIAWHVFKVMQGRVQGRSISREEDQACKELFIIANKVGRPLRDPRYIRQIDFGQYFPMIEEAQYAHLKIRLVLQDKVELQKTLAKTWRAKVYVYIHYRRKFKDPFFTLFKQENTKKYRMVAILDCTNTRWTDFTSEEGWRRFFNPYNDRQITNLIPVAPVEAFNNV